MGLSKWAYEFPGILPRPAQVRFGPGGGVMRSVHGWYACAWGMAGLRWARETSRRRDREGHNVAAIVPSNGQVKRAVRSLQSGVTIMQVLTDLSQADLVAKYEALHAENERLKAARQRKLTLKVSKAGAVSMYGMGRFPVTLYRGQWERVLAGAEEIKAFIEANADLLSAKD